MAMLSKHEWRKKEKELYLPKQKPVIVDIPSFQFISIQGEGNPNSPFFGEYLTALYSVAYGIKMSLKKSQNPPIGYIDWTIYPLEGVWDISDKAKKNFDGSVNKDELIFELMLRQPDFIEESYFQEILEMVKKKKPQKLLDKLKFSRKSEGKCIQMMHIGSYDDEKETFDIMEQFAQQEGVKRKSKIHREIYISDFRKVPKEKLKTTLRFQLD